MMSEKSNIISIFEGYEKKKKEGGLEKGGENSPISPPLDPRLRCTCTVVLNFRHNVMQLWTMSSLGKTKLTWGNKGKLE